MKTNVKDCEIPVRIFATCHGDVVLIAKSGFRGVRTLDNYLARLRCPELDFARLAKWAKPRKRCLVKCCEGAKELELRCNGGKMGARCARKLSAKRHDLKRSRRGVAERSGAEAGNQMEPAKKGGVKTKRKPKQ